MKRFFWTIFESWVMRRRGEVWFGGCGGVFRLGTHDHGPWKHIFDTPEYHVPATLRGSWQMRASGRYSRFKRDFHHKHLEAFCPGYMSRGDYL